MKMEWKTKWNTEPGVSFHVDKEKEALQAYAARLMGELRKKQQRRFRRFPRSFHFFRLHRSGRKSNLKPTAQEFIILRQSSCGSQDRVEWSSFGTAICTFWRTGFWDILKSARSILPIPFSMP